MNRKFRFRMDRLYEMKSCISVSTLKQTRLDYMNRNARHVRMLNGGISWIPCLDPFLMCASMNSCVVIVLCEMASFDSCSLYPMIFTTLARESGSVLLLRRGQGERGRVLKVSTKMGGIHVPLAPMYWGICWIQHCTFCGSKEHMVFFLEISLNCFKDERFVNNSSCSTSKEFDAAKLYLDKVSFVFEHNPCFIQQTVVEEEQSKSVWWRSTIWGAWGDRQSYVPSYYISELKKLWNDWSRLLT